jgi:hypothetical protein
MPALRSTRATSNSQLGDITTKPPTGPGFSSGCVLLDPAETQRKCYNSAMERTFIALSHVCNNERGVFTEEHLDAGCITGTYGDIALDPSVYAFFEELRDKFHHTMQDATGEAADACHTRPIIIPMRPEIDRATTAVNGNSRTSLLVLANEAPGEQLNECAALALGSQSRLLDNGCCFFKYTQNMAPLVIELPDGRIVVAFCTTREVEAGEELFWYYGPQYERTWTTDAAPRSVNGGRGSTEGHMGRSELLALIRRKRNQTRDGTARASDCDNEVLHDWLKEELARSGIKLDEHTCMPVRGLEAAAALTRGDPVAARASLIAEMRASAIEEAVVQEFVAPLLPSVPARRKASASWRLPAPDAKKMKLGAYDGAAVAVAAVETVTTVTTVTVMTSPPSAPNNTKLVERPITPTLPPEFDLPSAAACESSVDIQRVLSVLVRHPTLPEFHWTYCVDEACLRRFECALLRFDPAVSTASGCVRFESAGIGYNMLVHKWAVESLVRGDARPSVPYGR